MTAKESGSLEDVLRSLPHERLAGIVSELASMSTENMQAVVRAARLAGAGKGRGSAMALTDQEAGALADELQMIAAEFNELGGGLREGEDRAGELCRDLERILKSRPVSSEARADVIETLLPEVVEHNSGLDDLLTDAAFAAARTRDHWMLVLKHVEPLAEREDSGYYRNMAMHIYLDKLGDEETYLRLRQARLRMGADYYDLVRYWKSKGNLTKAAETAREGLEKGEGRLDELRSFLGKRARGRKSGDR